MGTQVAPRFFCLLMRKSSWLYLCTLFPWAREKSFRMNSMPEISLVAWEIPSTELCPYFGQRFVSAREKKCRYNFWGKFSPRWREISMREVVVHIFSWHMGNLPARIVGIVFLSWWEKSLSMRQPCAFSLRAGEMPRIYYLWAMTTYELMKLNEPLIQAMQQCAVEVGDLRYLEMYKEYLQMVKEGHKKTYIVAFLSDEYGVGQRTLYRVIERFSSDVDLWFLMQIIPFLVQIIRLMMPVIRLLSAETRYLPAVTPNHWSSVRCLLGFSSVST